MLFHFKLYLQFKCPPFLEFHWLLFSIIYSKWFKPVIEISQVVFILTYNVISLSLSRIPSNLLLIYLPRRKVECVVMTASAKVVYLTNYFTLHAWRGKTMKCNLVFRPKQTDSAWKQAPYGNNLQPTLALSRSVTTTDTIATLEGYSRTTVMNDCFMWNEPTWCKGIAL